MLTVPANFTRTTGAAHWELLLRARAVENQAFVVAPAQTGEYPPGQPAYGNSMIVDPWGEVLARALGRHADETFVAAELDFAPPRARCARSSRACRTACRARTAGRHEAHA